MTARRFVDTNVLLYADDPRDLAKQLTARRVFRELIATGSGVISTEVLQAYDANAVGKLGIDPALARSRLGDIAALDVVQVDVALILAATDFHRIERISF